ncbi:zinc finger protein 687a isoform X1 [Hypomesus transpacificus]|uniref:zinc finger protein 687a isoform X1 n=1 Tax=Hypomesus transpacificus TaxID=137520 RepID=UPI001F071B06|nr:zinc finger protein 687a isoform X1 [Hypomesus transpacificus]XP_046906134.1 zinc finger protein 687a isoform X1 [Hypomesus transpacificus]
MGDMKTPDFDDLLAAFDIPDIDAKEAIQSSPEDCGEDSGKGPSSSPLPPNSPPSPQGDTPVVSVIVKNSVRSDVFGEEEEGSDEEEDEEEEEEEEEDSPEGSGPTAPQTSARGGGSLLGARQASRMPGLVCSEPQIRNGFEGPPPTLEANARGQSQASGDLWSSSSPLAGREDSGGEGQSVSTARHTASFLSRLKPLLTPHTPLPTPFTSSPSDTQHLPPPAILHAPRPPSPPPTPPPSNGSSRSGLQRLMDSDSDSEPDLGSPLVIQESPDSPMRSPPKFPRRHRRPSQLFGSPTPSSPPPLPAPPLLSSPPEKVSFTPRCPPQPELPPAWLSSSLTAPDEQYPEHIIDERDSPESPPPDQTGAVPPMSKKSPSPAPAPAPMLQGPQGTQGPQGPQSREEPLESDPSQGSGTEGGEKMETEDGQGGADTFGPAAGSSHMDPKLANATATAAGPSRPLKVRIKTVKTPTGSITRTVTRVAPKVAGGTSKGVDGSRPPPAGRKVVTRPKRVTSQQQKAKDGSPLPVSTLQDASSAMLAAASKAQNSMAAESKAKVSATAVSITRSAALPSVTSSPRMAPAGVSVRSLGQKTVTSSMSLASPPQGGSRPASIVNSTGAIISRSQSSLVEAFNKILNSKNLLPSYKPDLSSPPPPEWGLPLPAQGFRCLECGDAFALERSLARHYDRRSLRIEVTCNHCAKRLAFFNKCSLLLHAREHKERGLVMQCSHLVMRPVSLEQMIGQQDTTPIGMLSVSPSMSSVLSPSVTALTTAPATGSAPQLQKQPIVSKKAEPMQYGSNKCPECHVQFNSRTEVVAHFQEVKPALNTSCMECSPPMLLPNGCSAAAHQRIHKSRPPHVCPECGGVAKQAAFQTHLEHACLHFARRIGYRCSSCLVVFGGLNSVKSHIQTAHCEVFHKCPSCPMAFKSAPSAQGHISTQHPTLTAGQAKMIYKCVMCDTVFTQKPLLYVHFDTHLTKQKVHVFKCPECTKLYAQRSSMLEHIKSTHKGPVVKQEVPVAVTAAPAPAPRARGFVKAESSDGEEWRDQEEEEEEEDKEADRAKTISGWSCAPCHARYNDKEDYITHMAEQHGKVLKKFPCSLCESSFSSTSSLRRHIRVKHKGIKRVFHCQLCTEGKRTFSSRLVLDRHIQLRHAGDTGQQPGPEDAGSSPEQDSSSLPPLSSEGGAGGEGEEGEDGGGGGGHRGDQPSQEASHGPPRPSTVRLPLCSLRLHHRPPGALPGAHPSAPRGRSWGRSQPAVPAVWCLLCLRPLPLSSSLHQPPGQRHGP